MSDLGHLLTEIGTIIASLWALLRFVFQPRLTLSMREEVAPVVERVTQLEHRASSTTLRLDGFEQGQERTEKAIERIGEQIGAGLDKLATSIHELAGKHEATAREVAELRGAAARKRR